MATPTPNWQSFAIQIPGQDLLESVREVLETLVVYLEVLKTMLETVKSFLIDFGNPIKAIVEALIALILTLFESLRRTGIYALYDLPDMRRDPRLENCRGGYQAFVNRFKGSLLDSRDPNRPQPIAGATKSGFVLLVVDAEGIVGLIRMITLLMKFFGKEFLSPQYPAPANFKVLPVGTTGDPIIALAKLFQEKPTSVVVEWALPPASRPGDPGFSDLVQAFSIDFIPPKFLIEKSAVNPYVELSSDLLGDPDAVGQVTILVDTNFEDRGQPGKRIKRKVRLQDQNNDPFIKFQKYIDIDTTSLTSILGQLGTFRYIDKDVEVGKTYYYRVRAYSGDLTINGTSVAFSAPEINVVDQVPFVQWPGEVVMGKSTPVAQVRLPVIPDFDVIENLKRVFQVAYSFNFHLPMEKGATFDSLGLPVEPTLASQVGAGSLTQYAGPLVAFKWVPIVGKAASATSVGAAQRYIPDPATGQLPEQPWQMYSVRSNSTRMATIIAGAMLESNSAEAFRALMLGPLPKGQPTLTPKPPSDSLSSMVFALTAIGDDGNVSLDTAVLTGTAFVDPYVRLNILAVINYVKGFTLVGTPPDWIQISLLRDIIPWSAQLLYELLAKIQALLDAYKGIIDEIKAFIDLIIRKIDTLERFIQYLISILDFILSLSLGVYILSAPEIEGDVNTWMELVDNAGGSPPPSGPDGYTAGVALAYMAPNIDAFVEAFKIIF
jgi:hypothetical protein